MPHGRLCTCKTCHMERYKAMLHSGKLITDHYFEAWEKDFESEDEPNVDQHCDDSADHSFWLASALSHAAKEI